MGKVWKHDGEEDKFIRTLIKKGKIHQFTKPAALQKEYPSVFGSFTPNVIRNHLNIVKRSNGLYLDGGDSDCDGEDIDPPNPETLTNALPRASNTDSHAANSEKSLPLHENYPAIVKTFTCPETENEKVLVVVNLPGGAENPKVELNDDGIVVSIKYSWPKAMYEVEDLFKKQLGTNKIHVYHPMLLCVKAGLAQARKKIDLAPNGLIKICLPMKVQTAVNSWTKWGVKRSDGTQVVLAVFAGYVKEYVKKTSDEAVRFE